MKAAKAVVPATAAVKAAEAAEAAEAAVKAPESVSLFTAVLRGGLSSS